MKCIKLTPLGACLLLCLNLIKVHAQTTTLSYVNIPNFSPTNCFFNSPPGPASPLTIGGLSHYGIVGGVDYTGSSFSLSANTAGSGSGFGIYYNLTTNYKYTITVRARASSGSMRLLWALNSVRTAIPSSCQPGFPNIITQGAVQTAQITNMPNTYADYTLVSDYVPANNNIKYILFSDYYSGGGIGNVEIQTVTITAVPICYAPTLNDAVVLGNGQVQVAYTPPAFTGAITQYNVHMNRYEIILNPFPIIMPTQDNFTFTNVGASPVTFTVQPTGMYSIWMESVCPTSTNVRSNSLSRTVN